MKNMTATIMVTALAIGLVASPVNLGLEMGIAFGAHHEENENEEAMGVDYVAILAAEDRSDADKGRDESRKPADVLAKVNLQKGGVVIDIGGGSGYYTEIFSRAVGEKGAVYNLNPPSTLARFESIEPAINGRIEALAPRKVVHIAAEYHELPEVKADVVFLGQMYHEVIRQDKDAAAINGAVFETLKPGGFYVIEIHRAKEGAGRAISESTHRADPEIVRAEVLAAGFELVEENTDLLGNPDDPLDTQIFSDIRGKTARTLFFFRKPE